MKPWTYTSWQGVNGNYRMLTRMTSWTRTVDIPQPLRRITAAAGGPRQYSANACMHEIRPLCCRFLRSLVIEVCWLEISLGSLFSESVFCLDLRVPGSIFWWWLGGGPFSFRGRFIPLPGRRGAIEVLPHSGPLPGSTGPPANFLVEPFLFQSLSARLLVGRVRRGQGQYGGQEDS